MVGMLNARGSSIKGGKIADAMKPMQPRYNGLGAGFAGYGIYPRLREHYALHSMFYSEESKVATEEFLKSKLDVVKDEPIPTKGVEAITNGPILWRFFVDVPEHLLVTSPTHDEGNYILRTVMHINSRIEGAYVVSSGRDMGVFKAVGFPSEVAELYRIERYEGYMWLGHGRYPTNTPGWWGGAHPFSFLGWSVVHNGEISSYGTNKRYAEQWGYKCTLLADSEVLAYLFDLLVRRHELPIEVASAALFPPFWEQIDRYPDGYGELMRVIRMTYGGALVNGPASMIVATTHGMRGMIGLTDRIKLRPLVAAKRGDIYYIASEECAIREVCNDPEKVWAPQAGAPVIAKCE
ncbi:MAG: glutamine amidotransferase family protein [Candidatus Bathyarchaeia archaeon]